MAGLDNIKKYADGALVDGEMPAEDVATPIATMQATASKGPYSLGKPVGKTAVSEDILSKMERLVSEREAQRGSFLESMKDATAWWSGGQAGPGEALAKRAAERQNQVDTTFGMQKELAQYRASQQRAKELQQQNAGLLGGQPAQGGGAPGAQAAPSPYDFLRPAAKMEFLRLNAQDPDAANEYLRKMVAKNQEIESSFLANPSAYNQAERWNPETKSFEMVDPVSIRARQSLPQQRAAVAMNQNTPAAAPTAQAITPASADVTPQLPSGMPVISGYRDPAKQAQLYAASQQPGYTGNPVAPPGQSLHQTPGMAFDLDTKRLTQEHKNWLASQGYVQTMPQKDPNHWAKLPAAPSAQAPAMAPVQAPVAAPVTTPGISLGLPGHQQAKLAEQTAKQQMEMETKALGTELEASAKDYAGRKAATIEASSNADTNLSNIKYLNNIINTNPKAFGVLQHPTVLAALGSVIEGGATVPGSGAAKVSNIDEAVRKAMKGSTEDEITAAQKAAQKFSELQLNTAKVVLKGQGSVSDNERALVANMTGSIKNSPAAVRDILKWTEMRASYDKRVGDAFDKWENSNPSQSFRKFMLTPEYKAMKLDYSQKIDQFAETAGKYKTPAAAPAKPSGYDAWKKSQG